MVACYTGLILWKLFCSLDSDQYPIKTYADVSERILGRWSRHVCTVLQSLQLIINVSGLVLDDRSIGADDLMLLTSWIGRDYHPRECAEC